MVDKPQSLLDLDALKAWIGRRELAIDRVDQQRVQQLAASLDLDHHDFQQGSVLPPLWHWIFATPISAMHQAGPDGHAARGGFLPPVPLPRRMWAGSRLHWHQDFKLADTISRESTVSAIETKSGRSGELVFVTVSHQWRREDELVLDEEHDIVYRDIPKIEAPQVNPAYQAKVWPVNLQQAAALASDKASEEISCAMQADEVLLFRYSALTFNSHKIHYDRRHCIAVEKYPGLIVHGPLMACMMGTLAWYQASCQRPRHFAFRALSPVFDGELIKVIARPCKAIGPDSLLHRQTTSQMQLSEGSGEAASEISLTVTDCLIEKADGTLAMQAQMAW
ncbi:MAG: acyl-CoA dehydrogenase [Betaproteobacteria bacterium]|jgi:3-methylfumaryl-CoA hydratase|nr:acyl-CoA dehydrogenase [Betaproteobacteria bacterium]NBO94923.1 acyl-CoA dehydrogenase [Betaproteobacteria bacterium]NCW24433.1 acyl-CoA dehydrogenase [Betaproteobacteria bacterium]NCW80260.1 acyl-CoA dehydrogenase [Betaproteobacteria bacterium]NDE47034.1 acyl-CoA dehydrogenase [Betaproteobacteria bacterium]